MRSNSAILLVLGILISGLASVSVAHADDGSGLNLLPVLDGFNRSESPLSNEGKWSALAWDNSTSGHNTGRTLSGSPGGWAPYDAYSTINGAYWNPTSFSDKGWGIGAEATMSVPPTYAGRYLSLWIDMSGPGSAKSGYQLSWTQNVEFSSVFNLVLSRWTAGAQTVLASNSSISIPGGSSVGIVAHSGTLSAWTGSGTLSKVLSASDSTYTNGYSGIEGSGNLSRVTNFKAGALPNTAVTPESLTHIPLIDDLQRNDYVAFSSSGVGAGKWSTPTAYGESAASRGGAWNGPVWLGYGASSGWAAAYWNAQTFADTGNGDSVEATLTHAPGNGEAVAVWLNQPSPTTVISGYELYIVATATSGSYNAYLYRWSGGTASLLASGTISLTASHAAGSTLALVEKNGGVSTWIGTAGSSFSQLWSASDATPFTSGYAGLQVYGYAPTEDNFSAGALPKPGPPAPVLTSTSPASPAENTTPLIIGTAESGTTVRLYTNGSCSGSPVATGSAATFASPGIAASVAKGSTTTFYATATNAEESTSACSSSSVTYKETSPTSYWGAWVQSAVGQSPFDMSVQTTFENEVGKTASIIHWSSPWFSSEFCGGSCKFQTTPFNSVRSHGSIPFFSWAPNGVSSTDKQIAEGAQDPYIKQWAEEAKSWGHPFFLRFSWEMNGSWFRWGVGNSETKSTAADYVAMWKHVHEIFTSVGATNATWAWCPNIDPRDELASMSSLYPGDSFVDWTCLDGYNPGDSGWKSFSELFSSSYSSITASIAPSKPMIVGETASTESGGSKSEWITKMLSGVPSSFPKIHGLLWFNKINEVGPGGHTDWPIESSTAATEAFSSGIQNGPFAAAKYGSLSTSPIPTP